MKILIIGGSGVIGSKLVKHFERNGCDTKFTYLSNPMPTNQGFRVDITEKNSIIEFIAKINPDYVIHTTALTNVDLCEKNHFVADNLNVNGTTGQGPEYARVQVRGPRSQQQAAPVARARHGLHLTRPTA